MGIVVTTLAGMAYSAGLIDVVVRWFESGILPSPPGTVVDIGAQMVNAGMSHDVVGKFIKYVKPDFIPETLSSQFPKSPHYYSFAADIWSAAGVAYFSYDVTGAPLCRTFDLNFDRVPDADRGSVDIVTNIGTTEHVINQLNAFEVVHDLLKIGGVAVHQVPFAGMLNHCFFNYHPKFFYSLIVNNRYILRYLDYGTPYLHSVLGAGNTVFEGDIIADQKWSNTTLHSGVVTLVIERRFDDPFVPPVDFAGGYFGESTGYDLSSLLKESDIPDSKWANNYRRSHANR